MLYQETLLSSISNVPAANYEFTVDVPVALSGGEHVEYNIQFHHTLGHPLTDLRLVLDLDRGFFDQLTILDGGSEDQQGRPTWHRDQLQPGATWKVRVGGQVRPDVTPGSNIRAQAAFSAATIPLLISDNPRTVNKKDQTTVLVRQLDGVIAGRVLLDASSAPVPGEATLAGATSSTKTVNDSGEYRFTDLAPGDYTVSVAADHYGYHDPAGPVDVTLRGLGETVTANFYLQPADERPPEVSLHSSLDAIVGGWSITGITQGCRNRYRAGFGCPVGRVEHSGCKRRCLLDR